MLTRYAIETGDKCVLSGVLSYGLFFNIKDNVPFFKTNAMKLYDKVMGFNYYMILQARKTEIFEHYGNETALKLFENLAKNRWSLMDISENVLAPLFGY
jgi:predicted alpha/beta-fold hydrolase